MICEKRLTFGRAGRSAGKYEICQGILIHGFRIILSGFLDGTNEIIERSFPFHLSFKNENPIRFRESSLLGGNPCSLEIPRTREDLSYLGDFDEVLHLIWSRGRRE